MDLTNKNQLLNYLQSHGLWAKKSMGQNFLVDRTALDKIVAAAQLSPEDTILEIGPGVGTLTKELVKGAGRVIAIEKDENLARLLNDKFLISNVKLNPNLQILNEDALEFDLEKLTKLNEANKAIPYKLVANIPYYITSKILEKFLGGDHKPELIVLLVQKEVAERICAKAGGLSLLAISVQYYGEPEIVDIVRRDSFFPAPEVDSAILRIRPTQKFFTEGAQKEREKEFFKTVKMGFRARRKTLYNNLKAGTNLNDGQIVEILDKMDLSRNVRAQELTIEQWQELAGLINPKV